MLPAARRQQIITLLQEKGTVSINDLCATFDVSAMTIHRDLDQLAADGHLRKVRGGAVPVKGSDPPRPGTDPPSPTCSVCYKKPRRHTQVILHLADGTDQHACCPHCALMFLAQNDVSVRSALVTDFLSGDTVSAQDAHYVVAPDVSICCTPTAVSFARPGDAERFQHGFGGKTLPLAAATTFIKEAMHIP